MKTAHGPLPERAVQSHFLSLDTAWSASKHLGGLPLGAAAWVIAQHSSGPTLVICSTGAIAAQVARDINFHINGGAPVVVLPPDDVRPYDGMSPHPEVIRARIRATLLLQNNATAIVVTCPRGLATKVLTPQAIAALTLQLEPDSVVDRDLLASELVQHGYHSVPRVAEAGTLSRHGDVLDIWPTDAEEPYRVVFFDDEIESIRQLDPVSFKSGDTAPQLNIPPAREAVPNKDGLGRLSSHTREVVDQMGGGESTRRSTLQDLRSGLWFPAAEDYLGAMHSLDNVWSYASGCIVIDPEEVSQRLSVTAASIGDRWESRSIVDRPPIDPWCRYADLEQLQSIHRSARHLSELAMDGAPDLKAKSNRTLFVGKGELAPVVGRIHDWLEEGWRVALSAESTTRAERLHALLGPHGLQPDREARGAFSSAGGLSLWIGELSHGFHCEDAQLAIISADELFGAKQRPQRIRKTLKEATLGSVNELAMGDLVVHVRHGVGRFEKLTRIDLDGNPQEFAEVQYRGGDRMYLPVTRLDEVYRYRSVGDTTPRLSMPHVAERQLQPDPGVFSEQRSHRACIFTGLLTVFTDL